MTSTDSAAGLAQGLLDGYALEAELYHALLALTREQGALLRRDEDMGRYAALFTRKDELLRGISGVEAEMGPLKQRWWTEKIEPENRERLNGLLDWILMTMDAIMAQEQWNEQLLLRHREGAQGRLERAPGAARVPAPHCAGAPAPSLMTC